MTPLLSPRLQVFLSLHRPTPLPWSHFEQLCDTHLDPTPCAPSLQPLVRVVTSLQPLARVMPSLQPPCAQPASLRILPGATRSST